MTLNDCISRIYVDAILAALHPERLHLSTGVTALATTTNSGSRPLVELTTSNGQTVTYDHVVLACHSNTALSILKAGVGLTEDEQNILGRFQWNRNHAVLHSDIRVSQRTSSPILVHCTDIKIVHAKTSTGVVVLELFDFF